MSLKEYSDSGTALADAEATSTTPDGTPLDVVYSEFQILPLAQIVASLTNPRKHFDQAALAELSESIKTSGVHQPVIVRPLPGDRVLETGRAVQFELVAGERRLRASVLAGVPTIPALVRELTDDQVLEIQIVENLQRADLSELEEAEGYEALMQHNRISAEQVGAKIGKSRAYVYARLKLLDLCQECKEALRAGQIDASRSLLIARIPDSKLQQKALAEATRKQGYNHDVLSVRELQSWLQQNVMLRLDGAPFGITEARLIEGAGSCKECPKRTGANPDLFAEVNSADLCTDPTCYARKCEAHRGHMQAKAQAKGMEFVDGKEAREIIRYNGGQLTGYTSLAQVREDVPCPTPSGHAPTLRDLLGKDAPAPVLIEHPWTKELIEAVPTAEAEAMLLARGLIADTAKATSARRDVAKEIEALQEDAARAIGTEYRANALAALRAGVLATPPKQAQSLLTKALLIAWLGELSEEISSEDLTAMFDMEFADDASGQEDARLHIEASDHATLIRALVIYMVLEDGHYPRWRKAGEVPPPKCFEGLAPAVGVDLPDLERAAKATVRTQTAEKIRKLKAEQKAQEAKALPPLSPAAQARTTGGGQAKTNAKVKKPKLSAAQAQAEIAAAMQAGEPEPSPGAAVAAQDIEGPVANALAVGTRVRVVSDTDVLPLTLCKWAGREGTVTALPAGDIPAGHCYLVDVTFKGSKGGVAEFSNTLLEVVNPGINPAAAPVPIKAWPFPPVSKASV